MANANIGKSYLDINYIKYYDSCTNVSDKRFKTNINPISYEQALNFVINAKPVSYELIDSPLNVHHGMVAQDIKKYVNIQKNWGLVQEDGDGFLSLNYIEMIPDMIVVMQQLVK
ncbi:MAG: tail fiber domain-containing protein [Clostridia bacterium]|nr:tail fiber domain-containing protein [Clostridia bacterium]